MLSGGVFPCPAARILGDETTVILTDAGDVGLYFEDRLNAMMVKLGDVEGVANAIVTMASDLNLRTEVGRVGRESGAVHFDFRSQGSCLFGWLGTVAAGQGALA